MNLPFVKISTLGVYASHENLFYHSMASPSVLFIFLCQMYLGVGALSAHIVLLLCNKNPFFFF